MPISYCSNEKIDTLPIKPFKKQATFPKPLTNEQYLNERLKIATSILSGCAKYNVIEAVHLAEQLLDYHLSRSVSISNT